MAQDLAGKKILITGGSRGIGLAIAKRAAADGAMVAIAAKTTKLFQMRKARFVVVKLLNNLLINHVMQFAKQRD